MVLLCLIDARDNIIRSFPVATNYNIIQLLKRFLELYKILCEICILKWFIFYEKYNSKRHV